MLGSLYNGSMEIASGIANQFPAPEGGGISLGSLIVGSAMAPWSLVQAGAQALGIPMEWLIPAP
ncbi:hypothetical protein NCCP2495_15750 [Dietzia sp. NCCP-2495]|uniref:hypothetical protein n=1 Tax=Dietzia sp. NCCP-2495 TaxID=2934675 RepID=UPI0022326A57|nr:hypothetical protein [Dietzia sp. NCCP-2495]GLB63696.1 hypothetical protein NCCP2495_15750 [Dietzia sp. NCCP-2495]